MNSQKCYTPYDIAEDLVTDSLYIAAFGKVVPNTPTFAPDEIKDARQYCDVLNGAYNAGVANEGASGASTSEASNYNTMTRNGS